jgi:hypothetical protein
MLAAGNREGGRDTLDRSFDPTHTGRQDTEKSYIVENYRWQFVGMKYYYYYYYYY